MEKQSLNRRKDVELFEAVRREYRFGGISVLRDQIANRFLGAGSIRSIERIPRAYAVMPHPMLKKLRN